ncbi:hypothetical protein [Flindersiella endophytica]
MSRRPRKHHLVPYALAECPAVPDQGMVEAWISRRGRPVLCCDVCHTTWYDPRDLDPLSELVVGPDGKWRDGDQEDELDRPARREELEALGWWPLVHPLSLRAHGEEPGRQPPLAPGTWSPPHPAAYWLSECPAGDDGRLVTWTTWAGRTVLFCDLCFRTWDDPHGREPAGRLPESGSWPDGDRLRRPATREQLAEIGWWELVSPQSLQARGEQA